MAKKTINSLLENVLEKITPDKQEIKDINDHLANFLKKFRETQNKLRINAEVFVGGSFSKGTVIKKDKYDLDVFIRFDKKYKDEEISNLTEKIIKSFIKEYIRIHGSRDYFRIKIGDNSYLELIPVIKVKNPKEARNITDLSYSHVKYVKKKIKKRIVDDIMVAKAFCYASNCYGAESYIKGFSGYSLELLICYYGSFMRFVKEIAKDGKKDNKDKIVIDIEKDYKNRNEILMNINSSKLQAPIILIDPTFKQRNVTAALSEETFRKFREACIEFLKKPTESAFEIKKIDFEKLKGISKKKKYETILLEAVTDKQEGDIAGSKLLKFYNHIAEEISRFFEIKQKEFVYNNKKSARYFFSVKSRGETIFPGPFVNQTERVISFKKEHKKTFIKNKKVFAKERIDFNIEKFIKNWREKNSERMNEMSIIELGIVD